MNAREAILAAVKHTAGPERPRDRYLPPTLSDPVACFEAGVRASDADIRRIANEDEVPEAALALLATASAPLRLHLPKGSALHDLPWHRAPGLVLSTDVPSGEDAALSAADYAIAETGTLAFLAGPGRPATWHFLPAREIVLVRRTCLVPTLEAMLAQAGTGASTINLVTGPSRTGDIEQTMERGAHGPRAVHILLAG